MKHKKEKSRYRNSRKLRFLIIFSALIHLIIAIIFLQHNFKHNTRWLEIIAQQLTPAQKEALSVQRQQKRSALAQLAKNQPKKVATLHAPKSNFGWVLFDEPANTSINIPTTLDGDIATSNIDHVTETTSKSSKCTPAKTDTDLKIKEKEAIISPQNDTPAQKQPPQIPAAPTQEIVIKKDLSSPAAGTSIQERIASVKTIEQKQEVSASQQQQMEMEIGSSSMPPEEQQLPHVRGAQRITHQQPSRNIIALTKGFIEKHHGIEGNDLIDRDGDPNIQPSLEELRHISYEAKISWCLQASWKQNFYYHQKSKPLEGDAVIEFTIDEYGKLLNHALLQSTGHAELDELIIKNLQFASPYPPLPKHFGVKTYTTSRSIKVYCNNTPHF